MEESVANFERVKALVPIERAARLLNLELHQEKNQLRGRCPACNQGDNRMLAITPSKGVGVFYCRVADKGGSCIDLVAHITGMSLPEAAEWLADTLPQAEDPEIRSSERETAAPSPPKAAQPAPKKQQTPFDPDKFAGNLKFDDAVATLQLNEEMAELYRIGAYRNKLFFPICPPDVIPPAWAEFDPATGKLRIPTEWLARNVTRLAPKRA